MVCKKIFLGTALCLTLPLLFASVAKAEVTPELQKKINNAVELGKDYLYEELKKSNILRGYSPPSSPYARSYPQGVLALHLYALIKAGASPRDLLIQKAFLRLQRYPLKRTYSVSLVLLALYAKQEALKKETKKTNGKTIQRRVSYLTPQEMRFANLAVAWLLKASIRWGLGGWGYSIPSSAGDNSNTQFAILGLWAGHKLGVQTPKVYWQNILRMYLELSFITKDKSFPVTWPSSSPGTTEYDKRIHSVVRSRTYKRSRGWGYLLYLSAGGRKMRAKGQYDSSHRPTMTIAGICGLMISAEMLGSLKNKVVQDAIGEGLSDIAEHLNRTLLDKDKAAPKEIVYYRNLYLKYFKELKQHSKNSKKYRECYEKYREAYNQYVLLAREKAAPKILQEAYFLYSLERLGAFSGLEVLGDREWYPLLAEKIVDNQEATGAFASKLSDHCLTLLFLSRATSQFLGRIVTGSGRYKPKPIAKKPGPKPRIVTGAGQTTPAKKEPLKKTESGPEVVKTTPEKTPPKKAETKTTETPPAKIEKISPPEKAAPTLTGMGYIKKRLLQLEGEKPLSDLEKNQMARELKKLSADEKQRLTPYLSLLLMNREIRDLAHKNLVEIFGADLGNNPEDWIHWYRVMKDFDSGQGSLQEAKKVLLRPELKGILLQKTLAFIEKKKNLGSVDFLLKRLYSRPPEESGPILQTLSRLTGKNPPASTKKIYEIARFYDQWWLKNNKYILLNETISQFISELLSPIPQESQRAFKILLSIGKPALPGLLKALEKAGEKKNPLVQSLVNRIKDQEK